MNTNKCEYCGREMVLMEVTVNEVKLSLNGEPLEVIQSKTNLAESYYMCKNCGKRVDM